MLMQTAASVCGKSRPQKHGVELSSRNPGMIRGHTLFRREVQHWLTWNHVGQQVDIQVDVGLGELRHIATEAQKDILCGFKMAFV